MPPPRLLAPHMSATATPEVEEHIDAGAEEVDGMPSSDVQEEEEEEEGEEEDEEEEDEEEGDEEEGEEEDDDEDDDEDRPTFGILSGRLFSQILLIAIGILIGLALSQPERFSLAALTRPASAPRVLPPSPPRTVYATLPADDEEYEADDDEDEAELPDGWEEHHDQQTGRAFYYHAATKTSTWERPSGDGAAAEDELPAGWTVHKDPGTGRPFYYSETTRESVWTHPGRRLPAGWEEHWDADARRHFYHHAATAESRWERPVE